MNSLGCCEDRDGEHVCTEPGYLFGGCSNQDKLDIYYFLMHGKQRVSQGAFGVALFGDWDMMDIQR